MKLVGVATSSFNGTMSAVEFENKYKKCTQCKHWKIKAVEFSPHNSRPCAYQAACKACRSANARAARYAKKNTMRRQLLKSGE